MMLGATTYERAPTLPPDQTRVAIPTSVTRVACDCYQHHLVVTSRPFLKALAPCVVWPHTQGDLLPGVGGQQEDEQRQAGDEHAGDEQVEAVVERPAPHGDGEGHVRVRLLAAVVVQLVALGRHTWGGGGATS